MSSALLCTTLLANFSTVTAFANDAQTIKSTPTVIKESSSIELNNPEVVNDSSKEVLTIDSLNSEISSIEDEIKKLNEQNEKLSKELEELNTTIHSLSERIVARKGILNAQARNLQTNPRSTSIIGTILSAKSFNDAVNKAFASNKIMEASAKQLKADTRNKEALEKQQKRTQTALEAIMKNQELIQSKEWSLNVKQAELDVVKLEAIIQTETDPVKVEEYKTQLETEKQQVEEAKQLQAEEEKKVEEQKAQLAELTGKDVNNIVVGTTSTASTETVSPNNVSQQVQEQIAQKQAEAVAQPVEAQPGSFTGVSYDYAGAVSYPVGQCTWGAKVLAPWAGPYWGNGGQWAASAAAAGFTVSNVPIPGAIACWNDGGAGHVAVVTDVQSAQSIQVLESNVNGVMVIANHRGWINPQVVQGYVSYIYPPGL